jgi:hypothetical protein
MSIEAMKMALEAMALCLERGMDETAIDRCVTATEALRAAIEQAEKQKPVIDNTMAKRIATQLGWVPKREWVGLTDEDIYSIIESNDPPKLTSLFEMTAWLSSVVEAKLKEKNT